MGSVDATAPRGRHGTERGGGDDAALLRGRERAHNRALPRNRGGGLQPRREAQRPAQGDPGRRRLRRGGDPRLARHGHGRVALRPRRITRLQVPHRHPAPILTRVLQKTRRRHPGADRLRKDPRVPHAHRRQHGLRRQAYAPDPHHRAEQGTHDTDRHARLSTVGRQRQRRSPGRPGEHVQLQRTARTQGRRGVRGGARAVGRVRGRRGDRRGHPRPLSAHETGGQVGG